MTYLRENPDRVLELTRQHVELVGLSILAALLIGVPLGIVVTRLRWLAGPVIGATGVLYTVPSLALFGILLPYTGLGRTSVVLALVPATRTVSVLGVGLPWVVLGAGVYPTAWVLARWYTRQAERIENDFSEVVEDS